jgi:hypothetical protein
MAKFGRLGSKKNNKKEALKRERKLAKDLGGRTQPNSGSMDGRKGDVVIDGFTIDDKHVGFDSAAKSYVLTTETLNKITFEAFEQDREPVLILKFYKGMSRDFPTEWVLCPRVVFKRGTAGFVEKGSELSSKETEHKSSILGVTLFNKIYRESLKQDLPPVGEIGFCKGIQLGASKWWSIAPLDFLKKIDFFERAKDV